MLQQCDVFRSQKVDVMLRSLARRHFCKICTLCEPRLIRLEKSSVFMFHGFSFSARNGFLRHREPRLQQGQLGAEGQKSDGGPTHFLQTIRAPKNLEIDFGGFRRM